MYSCISVIIALLFDNASLPLHYDSNIHLGKSVIITRYSGVSVISTLLTRYSCISVIIMLLFNNAFLYISYHYVNM